MTLLKQQKYELNLFEVNNKASGKATNNFAMPCLASYIKKDSISGIDVIQLYLLSTLNMFLPTN